MSAVNALPPPFNYWEAGDVFVAICELGMVESRLALPYRSPALRAFSNGDFAGFDVEELVAGYRIVRNWPTSFEALVRRAVAMHEHETQSLRSMLGALGKFLVPSASPTAITQLVREEMPAVAQSLKLPIKSARSAFMEGGRENGLITIAEIASQFQVDIKRLNQVGGSLHSLVTSSQCPRGVRLFDAAKVQAAFETRANAISTRKVCSRLGVLPFMLPALEEADILVEVGNHDARVLSAPDQIYQLEPIERLTARLFAPTVAAQSMPP
ncbi:MAG: hypothetical protein JWP35_4457 [Caulobacter sp.]|nr:hypothetical protein [Caulobacter sp.]